MSGETTFDFGEGPVPAHKHPNGGGWVADSARVSGNAWVSGDARVYGNAQVSGNARVSGDARVYGNAWVPLSQTDHGYFVTANWHGGMWRIAAGCRDFTIAEARAHWGDPDYHTPQSGSRIVHMLDWLEKQPVPDVGEGES